jgi:DNA-binding transcriptional LysR family regulator
MPGILSAGFVPDIIDRLSRKRPRVGVYVVESQTAEQEFRELRERSVDLMLGRLLKPLIDDDVDMEVLCEDRFLVAAGAASPWASRRKIALEELIGERWILFPDSNVTTTYVSKLFRASGLEQPRGIVGSFSMHLRMHLLATGRFVTIMQASVLRYNAARWGLKELPVDLRTRAAPIVLFTLKERTRSPLVEEFIEHARRAARPKK